MDKESPKRDAVSNAVWGLSMFLHIVLLCLIAPNVFEKKYIFDIYIYCCLFISLITAFLIVFVENVCSVDMCTINNGDGENGREVASKWGRLRAMAYRFYVPTFMIGQSMGGWLVLLFYKFRIHFGDFL